MSPTDTPETSIEEPGTPIEAVERTPEISWTPEEATPRPAEATEVVMPERREQRSS